MAPFQRFIPILAFYPQFSVLSSCQCFIPISVFYPHFSIVSPFQCFVLISVFLHPFQCFIPISALHPHFSVLSPFQRFILISVSVSDIQFKRFIQCCQMKFVNVHVDKHVMFMNFTKSLWFQIFFTNLLSAKNGILFLSLTPWINPARWHTIRKLWVFVFRVSNELEHTRKNAQVVTSLQTSCNKSVHKLSTSCVRTACS